MDVYQIVTDRIIAELESGNIPWHKPWNRPTVTYEGVKVKVNPKNVAWSRSTGKPYSFLNQMLLARPGEYVTFKQVQEAKGRIKKGEKSSIVVFFKMLTAEKQNANGEKSIENFPVLRYYSVWNIDQCEGMKPKCVPMDTVYVPIKAEEPSWNVNEECEAVVSNYISRSGVKLQNESLSDRAFYSPASDSITVPAKSQFKSMPNYYSTLFHESVHSTGHKSRLDRFSDGMHRFGDEEYSKEELVAEIGSASLLNMFSIETESSFRNSAAYIQNWLKALKDDRRMIVWAANRAEKAVNYILTGEISNHTEANHEA